MTDLVVIKLDVRKLDEFEALYALGEYLAAARVAREMDADELAALHERHAWAIERIERDEAAEQLRLWDGGTR